MYLRKEQNWELWTSFHPSNVGCISEGREICDCKYHVVDDKRTQSIGFKTFEEAEAKFIELTGSQSLKDKYIHQYGK